MSQFWAFLRSLLAFFGLWRARESGKEAERLEATEEVLDDAQEIDAARRDADLRDRVQKHTGWD